MSSKKTEHLQLHEWEGRDLFKLAEFNENFRKIDAGVKNTESKVGDLRKLATSSKGDVVSAVNEVANNVVDVISGEVDTGVLRTKIDEKLSGLETQYAPKLSEVTAQLAETALTNFVSKDNLPFDHLKENIAIGVSDYGLYFDGLNSNSTTIRELSLKKNSVYTLSLKAKGNGEKIRFQSYPDGAFISPDFVVNEGIIEYVFNTSDILVTQIKVIRVDDLIGNEIILSDIFLREKRSGRYVKSDREQALEMMSAVNLKTPTRIIDGRSNSTYNAFTGGIVFQGEEYYAFRQGIEHHSPSDPAKWGKVVVLKRVKGTLKFEKVDEISEIDGDPRDVNLSVNRDGTKMFLSYAITPDEVNYSNHYYVFEWNMIRSNRIDISSDNTFGWGNMLQTPNGYVIKCAYDMGAPSAIVLYRSNNPNPNDPGGFTKQTIATISGVDCYEPTIAYWGNFLVCMIRNGGSGYTLTYTQDFEGQTGWVTPLRHTTLTLHAPCLMPYNSGGEDLCFTASYYVSSSNRKVVFGSITKPNYQNNIIRPNQVKTLVIDDEMTTGGYSTLVPTDNGNFGVMYYRDEPGWTGASQFFVEVSKSALPDKYTERQNFNVWNHRDDVKRFDLDAFGYEFAVFDVVGIPSNLTEHDFTYSYKETATFDILYAEGFVVDRPNIEVVTKNPGKTSCLFTLRTKDGSFLPTAVVTRLVITKIMNA